MKINLRCRCGSEVEFEDPERTFVKPGGLSDEKGRFFLIQKQADDWLAKHEKCETYFPSEIITEEVIGRLNRLAQEVTAKEDADALRLVLRVISRTPFRGRMEGTHEL